MVAIKNSVPKEADQNGLYALESALLKSQRTMRLVVGVVQCDKVVTDPRTKERSTRVEVLRMEEIAPSDVREAELLFKRALSHRLGEDVLPIDLERAIVSIFAEGYWVDRETGEIHLPNQDDGALFAADGFDDDDPDDPDATAPGGSGE